MPTCINRCFRSVLLLTAAILAFGPLCTAQSDNEKYFTNTELVDQDGRKLRFYQDLMNGKVVAINTFYATCTSACPPINRNVMKLQDAFAANLGKELFLISITVDPEADTPEKLKAYANQYGAKPGRLFLTGSKENVTIILKKLGQYSEDKAAHQTLLLIGNDKTGLWKKAFALAKPEELAKVFESVLNDKKQSPK